MQCMRHGADLRFKSLAIDRISSEKTDYLLRSEKHACAVGGSVLVVYTLAIAESKIFV